MMDWNDAIEEAKEQLEISGWCSPERWEEAVELAKSILKEEAKKIATYEHKEYLNSEEWKIKKDICMKRDDYLCQDCLERIENAIILFNNIPHENIKFRIKAIEVHHTDYELLHTDEEIDSCVSLCRNCHELRHCFNRDGKKWLIENIERIIIECINFEIITERRYQEEGKQQHDDFINSLITNME